MIRTKSFEDVKKEREDALNEQTKGITIISLVITIIVLLILVGVSIGLVFNNEGLFSKASGGAEKYNKQKAREALEVAFSNLQMEKYEQGLTAEALDTRITEEINKMEGEELENQNEVIVAGHIFQIDRSIPKIIDELGRADGVVISMNVLGNEGWIKKGGKVTLSGVIKTYSGGNITEAKITRNGITTDLVLTDGKYTIDDITQTTNISIYGKDSNKKENTKDKEVVVKIDETAPTVDMITAVADGKKIKLNATGKDSESGIQEFNYTISPKDGLKEEDCLGTFKPNEQIEIQSTTYTKYTVTITATDNVGNITETGKNETVETRNNYKRGKR